MDAIEAIKKRRSVREFDLRKVPKEILEDLVDCGRLAATAKNAQPWEFVVITRSDTLQKIADATDYGKFISRAPACIAVLSKDEKYFLEDGSAATENIMIAARAYGIGSTWVAGDKKHYSEAILKILGAKGHRLVSLIPLGYTENFPVVEKRSLKDVIHWEKL